jgi:hypothetical protein
MFRRDDKAARRHFLEADDLVLDAADPFQKYVGAGSPGAHGDPDISAWQQQKRQIENDLDKRVEIERDVEDQRA